MDENFHREIHEDLPLYATGDLAQERLQEIEAHLKNCKACQDELSSLEETLGFIKAEMTESPAPPELDEFFQQRLEPALPKRSELRMSFIRRVGLQAAALLLSFVAGFSAQGYFSAHEGKPPKPPIKLEHEPAHLKRAWQRSTRGKGSLSRGFLALSALMEQKK